MDLKDKILERLQRTDKKVFITPNIPEKKIIAVQKKYASEVRADEIIVLFDDTLWGGAKESLILTNSHLIANGIHGPQKVLLDEIESINLEGAIIHINQNKFWKFHLPTKVNVMTLVGAILENLSIKKKEADNENLSVTEDDEKFIKSLNGPFTTKYFLKKFNSIRELQKINGTFNQLDSFCDKFFAESEEQKNAAYSRNVGRENAKSKADALLAYELMGAAFYFPGLLAKEERISSKFANFLLGNDLYMFELMIFVMSRAYLVLDGKLSHEQIIRIFEPFMTISVLEYSEFMSSHPSTITKDVSYYPTSEDIAGHYRTMLDIYIRDSNKKQELAHWLKTNLSVLAVDRMDDAQHEAWLNINGDNTDIMQDKYLNFIDKKIEMAIVNYFKQMS